ncbi:MAG: alpha-glucosidase/alpha-galactosidase [Clostridiales bacterium]|nr:alpha-glucosidase/alpha-galactosidase [Clostridiales bacterium]
MADLHQKDPKALHIAYIGGGSRGWAWGLMKDLAMDGDMCGTVHLYDIDHAAAQNNTLIGNRLSMNPQVKSRWQYQAEAALEDALTGADFVIISILPGTFEEMRSDVHAPEKYGIWQSVGDSIGLGGFMRAMRTVPMFVTIAKAIRDYAPDAWVINYTNPMTLCVRTLYEVFPGIKAFGCCHEVFGTQGLLCAMLEKEYQIPGVRRQDLHTAVTGINHFTWLHSASWQGLDLMPLYREFAEKYAKTGFTEGQDNNWMNNSFACAHRVKFDLFLRYGLIAAAGDRHLAEFTPQTYLTSPETVREWMYGLTSVDWRIDDLHNRLARARRLVAGTEEMDLQLSGEEGHLLIKALLGMHSLVSNVNVPNRGQIAELPLGAVVETNALFTRDRIEPILTPSMPHDLAALILLHVHNQENTLKAALTCDRALGFDTFMNDPQMTLCQSKGKQLFDEMLENQKAYLPDAWFK